MACVIILFLLLWPVSVGATTQEVIPGLVVVGWDRLSPTNQATLQHLMEQRPRAWYPWLRVITIDGAEIPQPWAAETCRPRGVWFYNGPCRFNVWSNPQGTENPFPADGPKREITSFESALHHELGHQIGAGVYMADRLGALLPWQTGLISEAGCEPMNYLRSMLPRCHFRDYPQEFMASMLQQWWTCSWCVLQLAKTRWATGNPHPMNQLVFILALFGSGTSLLDDDGHGTILAYDGGEIEIWDAQPWRCGGQGTIRGPGVAITITTNAQCRVTEVK